jgi:malonate transporter and related proteins
MLAIINIVVPVFGILALGFAAARTKYVSDGAGRLIAEFAFKVAMPSLLFRAMLNIGPLPGSPWKLAASYLATILVVWIITTLATLLLLRRPALDAPSIAMGATFGNTVMLGIPLTLTAFGPEAAAPIALLVSIDTPLLWIIATLHIEFVRRGSGSAGGASPLHALTLVFGDLIRNPIVVPLLLGTLWRFTGLGIPGMLDRILEILAGAAVPTALFSLGLSLAGYKIKGQIPTLSLIVVMKLAIYPAIAFAFATWIFELPLLWTSILLLFAAMPVGANAFLFATQYERAVNSVSAAIAVSTAIAVVSVAVILYVLKQQAI